MNRKERRKQFKALRKKLGMSKDDWEVFNRQFIKHRPIVNIIKRAKKQINAST